jgi:hypothetical protein
MIDTNTNKDGQPKVITGQLYGQHFKIFADSMRTAATEVGAKYILVHRYCILMVHKLELPDKTWNAGVFQ